MKEIKEYLNKCRDISCARIGRLITIKSKVFPTWSIDSTLSKSQQVILSVSQFSRSVMSSSLQHHGLQQARLPCPSPTPRAPTQTQVHRISDPIQPSHSLLSPCLPTFNLSQHQGLFQWVSSCHQVAKESTGASASASVLPMNIQYWFPLGWTGLISLQSKGLSRVFSNTTVQKHQFFSAQISSQSNSHIRTWLLEKP